MLSNRFQSNSQNKIIDLEIKEHEFRVILDGPSDI